MFEILSEVDSRTEGDTAGCITIRLGFFVECDDWIYIGTKK